LSRFASCFVDALQHFGSWLDPELRRNLFRCGLTLIGRMEVELIFFEPAFAFTSPCLVALSEWQPSTVFLPLVALGRSPHRPYGRSTDERSPRTMDLNEPRVSQRTDSASHR